MWVSLLAAGGGRPLPGLPGLHVLEVVAAVLREGQVPARRGVGVDGLMLLQVALRINY